MQCSILLPEYREGLIMRVGSDFMEWSEDQCFIFDEACDHAVYVPSNMSSIRVVMIVDFANPLLLKEKDY